MINITAKEKDMAKYYAVGLKAAPSGTSVVQQLRLCTPSAEGPRFDPWLGN